MKGFTLIEVLIAFCILGIIACVALLAVGRGGNADWCAERCRSASLVVRSYSPGNLECTCADPKLFQGVRP